MMRTVSLAISIAAMLWALTDVSAAARCSYMAAYPPAIGRHTFLLATATRGAVTATSDSALGSSAHPVPAQVMRVENVTGHQAEMVRAGLRTSGGTAVFVRYRIGMSCGPFPALDGAFDSVGVGGLYVGRPRPAERWVDGRPTFDILRAEHSPLPQRLSGPSGHAVITIRDTTPTMTSDELFGMYRVLWAEAVTPSDRSPGLRIRRWLAAHPSTARKQPAQQVALDMLSAVTHARIRASTVPFGGTFAISVVVPGVDSLLTYGQTSSMTRPWDVEIVRDSLTGVPVAIHPRSFAVDVTTAPTPGGFVWPEVRINPCAPIAIVVNELPIVVDADATWRGEIWPSAFLDCAPPGSALFALTRPGATTTVTPGPTSVRFRRHLDGRITFEARTVRNGNTSILVRGERISTEQTGSVF